MKKALLGLVLLLNASALAFPEPQAPAPTREGILQSIAAIQAEGQGWRFRREALAQAVFGVVRQLERLYPAPPDYRPYRYAGTPPGMTFDDAELFGATYRLRELATQRHEWSYVSPWLGTVRANLERRAPRPTPGDDESDLSY